MTTVTVTSLFTVETAASLLSTGLEVASALGVDVTSWRAGDPTRALFKFLAEVLASWEGVNVEYIKAGFLSEASGDWLTVLAYEMYGVEREAATYATSTVNVTNSGGGYYSFDVGDVVFKSATSGKTYHSTNAVTLAAGATDDFEVTADESGSGSSAAADEIDTFVTTFLGLTINSSTAAVGIDADSDDTVKSQCEDSLGALSPNGPADAYDYVVKNSDLTDESSITRSATVEDSSTGNVTVYVAGATGAVPGASVTAAQTAVEEWATPLTITPTASNSTNVPVAVTATVSGDDIPATIDALVEADLPTRFAGLRIATAASQLLVAQSDIVAWIRNLLESEGASNFTVSVSVPSGDTNSTAAGDVATVGTVTITET